MTKKILIYTLLLIAALTFLYPFYWMIVASLAPESEIGSLTFLPSSFSWNSYTQMFSKIPIGKAFMNSIFTATITTAGVITFCSMVGYALAKMEFKGRQAIFYIIIFTMTLPFQITLIPNYLAFKRLR